LGGLWALEWAWQFGRSGRWSGRGTLLKQTKTVGVSVLGGLWTVEWAWHSAETNLR